MLTIGSDANLEMMSTDLLDILADNDLPTGDLFSASKRPRRPLTFTQRMEACIANLSRSSSESAG